MKKQILLMIGLLASLWGCEAQPQQNGFSSLSTRPIPVSDIDRDRECAWINSEIARMRTLAAAGAGSQFALAFQAKAQQNIAYLDSRSAQIQCNVIRVAPSSPAIPMPSSFDACFEQCRRVTDRTKEACFDACK